jgi:hypothetical protein
MHQISVILALVVMLLHVWLDASAAKISCSARVSSSIVPPGGGQVCQALSAGYDAGHRTLLACSASLWAIAPSGAFQQLQFDSQSQGGVLSALLSSDGVMAIGTDSSMLLAIDGLDGTLQNVQAPCTSISSLAWIGSERILWGVCTASSSTPSTVLVAGHGPSNTYTLRLQQDSIQPVFLASDSSRSQLYIVTNAQVPAQYIIATHIEQSVSSVQDLPGACANAWTSIVPNMRSGCAFLACFNPATSPPIPAVGVLFSAANGTLNVLSAPLLSSSDCMTVTAMTLDADANVLYILCSCSHNTDNTVLALPVSDSGAAVGTVQQLATGADCWSPSALAFNGQTHVLHVICTQTSGNTPLLVNVSNPFCAPLVLGPASANSSIMLGSCGAATVGCGSCALSCAPFSRAVGDPSHTCQYGRLSAKDPSFDCQPLPTPAPTKPPPPTLPPTPPPPPHNCTVRPDIPDYQDASLGEQPCNAFDTWPMRLNASCTAGCVSRYPGSTAAYECVRGDWTGGPHCRTSTFCLQAGILPGVVAGALCGLSLLAFAVQSNVAPLSCFAMLLSVSDVVTDVLYLSRANFYHVSLFWACAGVLVLSAVSAQFATWGGLSSPENGGNRCGCHFPLPRAYGMQHLAAVRKDSLLKLLLCALAFVYLLVLLPVWWLLWFVLGCVGSVCKVFSVTACRHAWLFMWTGREQAEHLEASEQQNVAAREHFKSSAAAAPSDAITTKAEYRSATYLDSSLGASLQHARQRRRIDPLIYNKLLLTHLVCESLPLVVLQVVNNSLLRSWDVLAIVSLSVTGWNVASNLYKFGYNLLVLQLPLRHVPTDLDHGLLAKILTQTDMRAESKDDSTRPTHLPPAAINVFASTPLLSPNAAT